MTERICDVDGCDNPIETGSNSRACRGCWNRLKRDLAQMPDLVAELNVTITRQARVVLASSGRRTTDATEPDDIDPRGLLPGLRALRPQPTTERSAVKPLPIDIGASEALDLLNATLWPWVCEGIESHPGTPFVVSAGVVGLSRALLRLHGWLQGHPDGQLAIDEVAYAVKGATRAIDSDPTRVCLGRCGYVEDDEVCDEWLYVTRGARVARCRTCGSDYDVEERERGLLELARDRLVTTTEACAAVRTYGVEGQNITREQVRQWKSRGRLVPRGHTVEPGSARPVDLWLLGDVIDLATRG